MCAQIKLVIILHVLASVILGANGVKCYWCTGVGEDRSCERNPRHVTSGPGQVDCPTSYCITTKVINAATGLVNSFARNCDHISHGNVCVEDGKLVTCYQTCTTHLCNHGNPDPSNLPVGDHAREYLGLSVIEDEEIMNPVGEPFSEQRSFNSKDFRGSKFNGPIYGSPDVNRWSFHHLREPTTRHKDVLFDRNARHDPGQMYRKSSYVDIGGLPHRIVGENVKGLSQQYRSDALYEGAWNSDRDTHKNERGYTSVRNRPPEIHRHGHKDRDQDGANNKINSHDRVETGKDSVRIWSPDEDNMETRDSLGILTHGKSDRGQFGPDVYHPWSFGHPRTTSKMFWTKQFTTTGLPDSRYDSAQGSGNINPGVRWRQPGDHTPGFAWRPDDQTPPTIAAQEEGYFYNRMVIGKMPPGLKVGAGPAFGLTPVGKQNRQLWTNIDKTKDEGSEYALEQRGRSLGDVGNIDNHIRMWRGEVRTPSSKSSTEMSTVENAKSSQTSFLHNTEMRQAGFIPKENSYNVHRAFRHGSSGLPAQEKPRRPSKSSMQNVRRQSNPNLFEGRYLHPHYFSNFSNTSESMSNNPNNLHMKMPHYNKQSFQTALDTFLEEEPLTDYGWQLNRRFSKLPDKQREKKGRSMGDNLTRYNNTKPNWHNDKETDYYKDNAMNFHNMPRDVDWAFPRYTIGDDDFRSLEHLQEKEGSDIDRARGYKLGDQTSDRQEAGNKRDRTELIDPDYRKGKSRFKTVENTRLSPGHHDSGFKSVQGGVRKSQGGIKERHEASTDRDESEKNGLDIGQFKRLPNRSRPSSSWREPRWQRYPVDDADRRFLAGVGSDKQPYDRSSRRHNGRDSLQDKLRLRDSQGQDSRNRSSVNEKDSFEKFTGFKIRPSLRERPLYGYEMDSHATDSLGKHTDVDLIGGNFLHNEGYPESYPNFKRENKNIRGLISLGDDDDSVHRYGTREFLYNKPSVGDLSQPARKPFHSDLYKPAGKPLYPDLPKPAIKPFHPDLPRLAGKTVYSYTGDVLSRKEDSSIFNPMGKTSVLLNKPKTARKTYKSFRNSLADESRPIQSERRAKENDNPAIGTSYRRRTVEMKRGGETFYTMPSRRYKETSNKMKPKSRRDKGHAKFPLPTIYINKPIVQKINKENHGSKNLAKLEQGRNKAPIRAMDRNVENQTQIASVQSKADTNRNDSSSVAKKSGGRISGTRASTGRVKSKWLASRARKFNPKLVNVSGISILSGKVWSGCLIVLLCGVKELILRYFMCD
ncbi:hypothetical protein PoB_000539800 [Plakobranchus ocellatus]|uniref:Uncharacterized protein n=1 Tax=Plakobranchus ocellatus TaxID=259542 RepID=A0AAV3Y9S0_9GAST|nr:hypothetical protein PoB_000539800 [Plakobranchus ocellatus]